MKFLVLLLLSFSVFAKLPIANISGFSGSYDDPSGQAQAASFRFEDIAFDPNASFAVEKQAGVFLLQTPDQEVEIDSIPSFINDLETLNWSGISLQSNDSTIDLEIQRLNGQNSERKVNLKGLKISCRGEGRYNDLMSDLLDSCLNTSGNLDLNSIVLNSTNKNETTIEDLNLDIRNNNLDFKIRASGYKVRGDGKVFYEEDKVRLRIDKAKAGFFNVKGILFKQLEKMESQTVKVDNPWVTIYLNQ